MSVVAKATQNGVLGKAIGSYQSTHGNVRLAIDKSTSMAESTKHHAFVVDGLRMADPACEPASAVQASDVEAVHQADWKAVQRAPRPAVLAKVSIQMLSPGGCLGEVELAKAVGQLVSQGSAVAEGTSDLAGGIIATAQGSQQLGGWERSDGPLDRAK